MTDLIVCEAGIEVVNDKTKLQSLRNESKIKTGKINSGWVALASPVVTCNSRAKSALAKPVPPADQS